MGASLLGAKFVRDITSIVLNPITENAGKIKTAIQNTLDPISNVLTTLANSFTHLWQTVNETYDNHIKPMLDSFKEGISQILGHLLDGYNEHIAPVLDRLAEIFKCMEWYNHAAFRQLYWAVW